MAQSQTGYLRTVPWSFENIDGNVLNPIWILSLDDNKPHKLYLYLFDCLMDPPHVRSTFIFMYSWAMHTSLLLSLFAILNFAYKMFIYMRQIRCHSPVCKKHRRSALVGSFSKTNFDASRITFWRTCGVVQYASRITLQASRFTYHAYVES